MTADDLARTLTRLRLVDTGDLEQCRREAATDDPGTLLNLLEQKTLLSSFQTGKLRKGETDGLVIGNYAILYRNAAGSFARVFRARSLHDHSMVGLKVLRQRLSSDPAVVDMFRREGEFGKTLKHKNIVPIYEVASDGNQHYFTMEFVEGGNLKDFIKIRKKLSTEEACKIILDVAEGLEYALSLGVTHRDMKLSNVLISIQGVAKLVDFGLAGTEQALSKYGDVDQRAVEYAALEKGTNAPKNDPRSDLYFLGAMMYELLTGTPPYEPSKSREDRKQFSRYTNIRPIRSIDPSVPKPAADIVDRLLEINPHSRYQTPTELAADLRAVLGDAAPAPAAQAAPAGVQSRARSRDKNAVPTLMCIESRSKQQNVLRDYFSKRGFRVLMLADLQRGLARLENNPPDCILLMGDLLGDDVVDGYAQAVRLGRAEGVVVVALLADKQAGLKDQFEQSETARVLVQPLTLRDVRQAVSAALGDDKDKVDTEENVA